MALIAEEPSWMVIRSRIVALAWVGSVRKQASQPWGIQVSAHQDPERAFILRPESGPRSLPKHARTWPTWIGWKYGIAHIREVIKRRNGSRVDPFPRARPRRRPRDLPSSPR